MKIFFDTEFLEDGKTIELISIGMVREDGQTLYLENAEFDWEICKDSWLVDNVLPSLSRIPDVLRTRKQITNEILEFVGNKPEFWGWFADYDWVVLCQLFGRMIDLPIGWPMYCRDLKQITDEYDIILPKQISVEHNALNDALWTKESYKHIMKIIGEIN